VNQFYRGLIFGFLFLVATSLVWAQPTTQLKPRTLEKFEEYVQRVEGEISTASATAGPGFWISRLGEATLQKVEKGEIIIQAEEVPEISGGLVHDWSGAIFIPGVQAIEVFELLTDYDRHSGIYAEVLEAETLENGEGFVFGRLLLKKKRVLTVVLDTKHRATYTQLGPGQWRIFSHSTKIAEVRDFGSSEQKELPVGQDSGFLWRLNAYWGVFEEKGGVFVACTTISLSRDIPWGLGWVIGPIVKSMPRETLEDTLLATRVALVKTID
jgi:hypothetical protein